ncbi:hypothetical protein IE53DRAFT_135667 [Violaceomyces palustris]|uniref:Uncharacterized protein n=1 Tax=Violaceomyces palustris TaxID=1673888 RepID=A0ACD0NV65_9BASI|nr:hypothetical protein IE53DRAFT_135667 [Violaceomyces palustris]
MMPSWSSFVVESRPTSPSAGRCWRSGFSNHPSGQLGTQARRLLMSTMIATKHSGMDFEAAGSGTETENTPRARWRRNLGSDGQGVVSAGPRNQIAAKLLLAQLPSVELGPRASAARIKVQAQEHRRMQSDASLIDPFTLGPSASTVASEQADEGADPDVRREEGYVVPKLATRRRANTTASLEYGFQNPSAQATTEKDPSIDSIYRKRRSTTSGGTGKGGRWRRDSIVLEGLDEMGMRAKSFEGEGARKLDVIRPRRSCSCDEFSSDDEEQDWSAFIDNGYTIAQPSARASLNRPSIATPTRGKVVSARRASSTLGITSRPTSDPSTVILSDESVAEQMFSCEGDPAIATFKSPLDDGTEAFVTPSSSPLTPHEPSGGPKPKAHAQVLHGLGLLNDPRLMACGDFPATPVDDGPQHLGLPSASPEDLSETKNDQTALHQACALALMHLTSRKETPVRKRNSIRNERSRARPPDTMPERRSSLFETSLGSISTDFDERRRLPRPSTACSEDSLSSNPLSADSTSSSRVSSLLLPPFTSISMDRCGSSDTSVSTRPSSPSSSCGHAPVRPARSPRRKIQPLQSLLPIESDEDEVQMPNIRLKSRSSRRRVPSSILEERPRLPERVASLESCVTAARGEQGPPHLLGEWMDSTRIEEDCHKTVKGSLSGKPLPVAHCSGLGEIIPPSPQAEPPAPEARDVHLLWPRLADSDSCGPTLGQGRSTVRQSLSHGSMRERFGALNGSSVLSLVLPERKESAAGKSPSSFRAKLAEKFGKASRSAAVFKARRDDSADRVGSVDFVPGSLQAERNRRETGREEQKQSNGLDPRERYSSILPTSWQDKIARTSQTASSSRPTWIPAEIGAPASSWQVEASFLTLDFSARVGDASESMESGRKAGLSFLRRPSNASQSSFSNGVRGDQEGTSRQTAYGRTREDPSARVSDESFFDLSDSGSESEIEGRSTRFGSTHGGERRVTRCPR